MRPMRSLVLRHVRRTGGSKRSLPFFLALLFAAPWPRAEAAGPAPRFEVPVICEIGSVCFIQNYFDRDAGPAYDDYAGGTLSYDGHNGVDIRVPNLAVMREGVEVVAAADGKVRNIRDTMRDIDMRKIDPEKIEGREAGNAVAIDHGDGWESQYSHLMRGSVRVKPGEEVKTGQVIGKIGLSGATEFPHVHFSVRRDGVHLDPFTGLASGETGQPAPLWSEAALARLAYIPAGVLSAGFADEIPKANKANKGKYRATTLPNSAPLLVFWVDVFGIRAGDREEMRFIGPDGSLLAKSDKLKEEDKAQNFRGIGKKLKQGTWPSGQYRGEYRLLREKGGQFTEVAKTVRILEVR